MAKRRRSGGPMLPQLGPPPDDSAIPEIRKPTTPAAEKVPGFDYIQVIRDGDQATLFWRPAAGDEGRWSMELEDHPDATDDQLRMMACNRLAVPDVYAPRILVTKTL